MAEIALRERNGQHQLARYSLLEADSQADIERRVFVDQLDGSRHEIRLQASSGLLQFRAGCSEHELKTRRLYQVLP